MKIISASRRTDIAAFYMPWFMNRVRAGWCEWYNPFSGKASRISLEPPDVEGIVFWTRHPAALLRHTRELSERGYRFYVHVTINGYGRSLEPKNPGSEIALRGFRALSERMAPDRILWRYDPILITEEHDVRWHAANFERLAKELEGYTRRCYFSAVDLYGKTQRNMTRIGVAASLPGLDLIRRLRDMAGEHAITLHSCCEDWCVGEGIEKAHCVAPELLGGTGDLKAKPTREQCGCYESVDIGAYDTCLFGCAYCYATNSWEAARRRHAVHDPEAPGVWVPQQLSRL